MSVCRNCGAELVKGALFCRKCGTKVEKDDVLVNSDIEPNANEIEQLGKKLLSNTEESIGLIISKVKELENSDFELKKVNEKIESLTNELEGLNAENESLNKELEGLKAENESLNKELEELKAENESLNKELEETSKEKESLNQEIEDLKNKVDELDAAISEEKEKKDNDSNQNKNVFSIETLEDGLMEIHDEERDERIYFYEEEPKVTIPEHEEKTYCIKCGAEVDPDEDFCIMCGAKIERENKDIIDAYNKLDRIDAFFTSADVDPIDMFTEKDEKIYCSKCGAEVEPDEAFCINCGAKIER